MSLKNSPVQLRRSRSYRTKEQKFVKLSPSTSTDSLKRKNRCGLHRTLDVSKANRRSKLQRLSSYPNKILQPQEKQEQKEGDEEEGEEETESLRNNSDPLLHLSAVKSKSELNSPALTDSPLKMIEKDEEGSINKFSDTETNDDDWDTNASCEVIKLLLNIFLKVKFPYNRK